MNRPRFGPYARRGVTRSAAVLEALRRSGPLGKDAVAERFGMTPTSAGKVLGRLVRLGRAERIDVDEYIAKGHRE